MKDPGEASLERLQVIKGWFDKGATYEKIYDVEVATDSGAESLSAVWTDTEFDPTQPAFYYVRTGRVVEPTDLPGRAELEAILRGDAPAP